MRTIFLPRGWSGQSVRNHGCDLLVMYGILALFLGEANGPRIQGSLGLYSVGMKQMEYVDPSRRPASKILRCFIPPHPDNSAPPYHMLFFTNLHLYLDAPEVADTLKHPLIMFSHGAGSNGLYYAWFGEYLAPRGYLVAMLSHYRANTYRSKRDVCAKQAPSAPARYLPSISGILLEGRSVGAAYRCGAGSAGGAFEAALPCLDRRRQDQS